MIRIVFPYILFISLTSLAGGVLNVYRRFAIPAFTPVLLNVAIIAAALFLAPHVDPPIVALAWGVFVGGIAQLAFQVRPSSSLRCCRGRRSIYPIPASGACSARWARQWSACRPRRSRR